VNGRAEKKNGLLCEEKPVLYVRKDCVAVQAMNINMMTPTMAANPK
jgi:hypothetical protein